MRILVAFGTRPEIIKLAPVCRALQAAAVDVDVFWSGQHVELAAGLLKLFKLTVTYSGSDIANEPGLAGKFGLMTCQIEKLLKANDYDWIVVQGDTATAAAAATAGFMNRVPVAHVEAGLRTGDLNSPWPEEFNRRVITLASALHFAPTPGARNNLLREGIPGDRVITVGNTVVDALLYVRQKSWLRRFRATKSWFSQRSIAAKTLVSPCATCFARYGRSAPMATSLSLCRSI
jgi:UDP-N-acetylglucosamine 2-epimerase